MKKALGVAALTAILVLTGCSSIKEGTIIAKEYEEGRYYSTTSCSLVGKTTVCTPITHYDDPDWKIYLQNGDEKGWREISEESWLKLEVGQWVRVE